MFDLKVVKQMLSFVFFILLHLFVREHVKQHLKALHVESFYQLSCQSIQ